MKENNLISKKHKKVCTALDYIEHLLILAFPVTRCVSISAYASLVGVFKDIASSVIFLCNNCRN